MNPAYFTFTHVNAEIKKKVLSIISSHMDFCYIIEYIGPTMNESILDLLFSYFLRNLIKIFFVKVDTKTDIFVLRSLLKQG